MCKLSYGAVWALGIQHRMKCPACGNVGAAMTLHGYWTGPEWARPITETVESRIPSDQGWI
jgi:hypothetical protein